MRLISKLGALGILSIVPLVSTSARVIDEPKATSPNTLTVKVEAPSSTDHRGGFAETVKALAEFLGAVAWPGVFLALLVTQRKEIGRIVEVLLDAIQSSKHIKLGELIDLEVDRSARQAEQRATPTREVSKEELEAASRVGRIAAPTELPAVRARILEIAREYEATRANMAPGPDRTRAMNAIVAKMRTLAIAAKPLVKEFSAASDSSGMRLAAIAILQLSPDLNYVEWLVERMKKEQPFVFFQASLAVLATVRSYGSTAAKQLKPALEEALQAVKSFKEGQPDQNTVDALELALRELRQATEAR